jgi:hypothetical protein
MSHVSASLLLSIVIGAVSAKGDARGQLGVPLAPIQTAVARLRGVLPTHA